MTTDRLIGAPSLRRTWTGIAVMLVTIIVGLGSIALASTQYQRVTFDRTTADLQRNSGAGRELDRSLFEVNQRIFAVLYEATPEARAAGLEEYQRARDAMVAAFEAASSTMAGTSLMDPLTVAEREWSALTDAVETAEVLWADGTAPAAFAVGVDPYKEPVWGRVITLTAALSTLGEQSVEALRAQVADANRVQLLIGPLLLAAVVLALGAGGVVGKRMQRRVLGPLVQLRAAAVAMRETDIERIVEVPGASSEIQELATTLNETSMALRASHSRLHDEAHTDALSGLPNRRAFVDAVHLMLDQAHDGAVGVLFIDLDDFKVVNDSLGHAAGDELLRVVGRRLCANTRDGEVVARLGGDEFAIAVSGTATAADLATVAERVLSVIQHPVTLDDNLVTVRCSIGVARSDPGSGPDAADELMRNADFAMYMAKGQGKSCYEVFAPAMHSEVLARTELKRDLAVAAPLGQLVLVYQPVVELASERLIGFEALVRWEHPERGLLSPAEFIALAEDTGDIVAIGEWVLDEACATLAVMHRQEQPGQPGSRPWMSVNASAIQLVGHGLLAAVDAALERNGLVAGDLVIEITEGVAMTNTKEASETLAALRERGVHIALDDFGTGYSSLRWLSDLPVDVVKIDRSFVSRQGDDSESMLEAIVALGQRLGLQVIAEGIEEPWELDRLRRLGAEAGQGFLLARPMPAAKAATFGAPDRTAADQPDHPEHRAPADLRA